MAAASRFVEISKDFLDNFIPEKTMKATKYGMEIFNAKFCCCFLLQDKTTNFFCNCFTLLSGERTADQYLRQPTNNKTWSIFGDSAF